MDELIRFLWLHGVEQASSEILVYVILFLMATGSIIRSKLLLVRDQDAIMASAVVFIILNTLLILSAVIPSSPLLGVTGSIYPSPWSHGLYQSLCIECMLVSLVFGLVSGTLHSFSDILQLFTYGIQKCPWAILVGMLIPFFI